MRMGQVAPVDARARAEAQEKLARALHDLEKAEGILASIQSAVGAREEAHRITSDWMGAMALEARRALSNGTLDRLMTPAWLRKLGQVGQRHDQATTRLEEGLDERRRAVAAHATLAARVRALRAGLEKMGPAQATAPGRVQPYYPGSPVGPTGQVPYYPWIVSPFYSIAPWSR